MDSVCGDSNSLNLLFGKDMYTLKKSLGCPLYCSFTVLKGDIKVCEMEGSHNTLISRSNRNWKFDHKDPVAETILEMVQTGYTEGDFFRFLTGGTNMFNKMLMERVFNGPGMVLHKLTTHQSPCHLFIN